MSYEKMIKWNKKHRKGTKQTVIMHTESGFWPSNTFMDKYFKYQQQCVTDGVQPLDCETYYKSQLK